MPDATTEQQKGMIRALFTRVAPNYDKVNRLLSLGQDQKWRQRVLTLAHVPEGGRLLDVATGTGDVAAMAATRTPSGFIVGTDLTPAMLTVARQKAPAIPWVLSDGLSLAFADYSFDVAISVFMLRNVPDVAQAFREQVRVVRPGGRVVCMEMTWPRCFPMSWLFNLYFFGISPLLGQIIAGDRAAYTYLPESVKRFPRPEVTAQLMEAAGLHDVFWEMHMFDTVAILAGTR